MENLTAIKEDIDEWFDFVGDREKELQGIYDRGDFWCRVLEEWERLLRLAEEEYCWIGDVEAREMSRENLMAVVVQAIPVRPRAKPEVQESRW